MSQVAIQKFLPRITLKVTFKILILSDAKESSKDINKKVIKK